jgi:TrmH family RNA methyltransferase
MITSLQNPKIKEVVRLRKASKRRKDDLILVEGYKELCLAVEAGISIVTLFYGDPAASGKLGIPGGIDKNIVLEVSPEVFRKMSYRENPDGWLGLAKPRRMFLSDLKLSENPLVIVLEAVEKPGNLGAIFRTADAAGADAVIVCDSQTDIYNPNVIRASLGTVFTNRVITDSCDRVIAWLHANKIKSIATTPNTNKVYTCVDFREAVAIVIGAEHSGLSKKWLTAADRQVKIPMQGRIDSLNASVSAAVVVFEAIRQRES